MASTTSAYEYAHSLETDVPAAAIWSLYEDVTTWPLWDAQAELITRDGPFVTGTTGTMKFSGQDPLSSTLSRVEPLREFVDETAVGEIVVRVSHRLEPLDFGRLRVTYAAEIEGPEHEARQLGPMITADFPETINALIRLARERSA